MVVLAWWYFFLDQAPPKPPLLVKIVHYFAWIFWNVAVRFLFSILFLRIRLRFALALVADHRDDHLLGLPLQASVPSPLLSASHFKIMSF